MATESYRLLVIDHDNFMEGFKNAIAKCTKALVEIAEAFNNISTLMHQVDGFQRTTNDSYPNPYYKYDTLDNLKAITKSFVVMIPKPFIHFLFYRKCFMVLKDFRNVRRSYKY